MAEKRKHKRIKVKTFGEVQRKSDQTRFKVSVGDISFGGLEIFSDKKLEIGDRFDITLTFLAKKGSNLVGVFPGEVRWAVSYNQGFIGGFQFDKVITKDGQPEFFSFVLEGKGILG